jgi:ketosteroid isomerase-like protein
LGLARKGDEMETVWKTPDARTPTARDRIELGGWIEAYGRAWQTGDNELMTSLFTEEAKYRSAPFREPFRGHDEIRAYARRNAGTQRDKHVRMGRPFIDGSRVAVEWWTTMIEDGEAVTLPGCLLLHFEADGRCSELREYWHVEAGTYEPSASWGT